MNGRGDWEIDKRISVIHLFATLGLAGSVFLWASGLTERVAKIEEQVIANERALAMSNARQDRAEMRLEGTLADIRRELVRINDKLDEKADR